MPPEPAPLVPIRVILIEDHAMVRAGIRLLLEREPDLAVAGEATDGADGLRLALDLAAAGRVDLVVTDLGLPDLDGRELTRRLKAAHPALPVRALTIYDDEAHVRGAFDAGADAYVLKEESARELPMAIRAVCRGEAALSPRAARALLTGLRSGYARGRGRLSARQREVLHLLAAGLTSKEIARRLGLSPKTVENHRAQLLDALDMDNTAAAVRLASQQGLLEGSAAG
jgi:two-component system response regulator NreC